MVAWSTACAASSMGTAASWSGLELNTLVESIKVCPTLAAPSHTRSNSVCRACMERDTERVVELSLLSTTRFLLSFSLRYSHILLNPVMNPSAVMWGTLFCTYWPNLLSLIFMLVGNNQVGRSQYFHIPGHIPHQSYDPCQLHGCGHGQTARNCVTWSHILTHPHTSCHSHHTPFVC